MTKWYNENENRIAKSDAIALAEKIAREESRVVEVGVDYHGGYPVHFYVLGRGEKHRAFGHSVCLVNP